MSKITIDLDKWTTQAKYAELHGLKLTTVSQRVVRTQQNKTNNPVNILPISELGIVLIDKTDKIIIK